MFITSRSGLAKNKIYVPTPGIIDPDYRGEIYVNLTNYSDVTYQLKIGDRIAQGLVQFVLKKQELTEDFFE